MIENCIENRDHSWPRHLRIFKNVRSQSQKYHDMSTHRFICLMLAKILRFISCSLLGDNIYLPC